MTALSVIVPVYNVERYLAECLDSILSQSFLDLEVIAVDDCSPDGSPAILEHFASIDSRVRVVRLERNAGLGYARNAGLNVASGRYVWFVDSDDFLFPGAIARAMTRILEQDAEVAVLGWVRDYGGGRRVSGTAETLLATAPAVFSLETFPEILTVLQVAWNKVIRREWLVTMALRFEKGWYEDTSFTYPLLAAASRITTLSEPCISYRQRETGSITATTSDRHTEVFYHWERAYRLIDECGKNSTVAKKRLFTIMLDHYLHILLSRYRLPKASKSQFLLKMKEHYFRFAPGSDYRPADAWERARHLFIASRFLLGLRLEAKVRRILHSARK